MSERPASEHRVVLRPVSRTRWALRRATRNVPRAVLLLALLCTILWASAPISLAAGAGIAGIIALVIAAVVGRGRPGQTTARIDATGAHWEGGSVERSRLVSATVARVDGDWEVELKGRGPIPWAMKVGSDVEARRIIDTLGLGLDRQVHEFQLASRLIGGPAWAALCVVFTSYVFAIVASQRIPPLGQLAMLATLVGGALALVLRFVPGHLVVGRDALRYRWLAYRRTYRLSDVASAHLAMPGAPGGGPRSAHRVILHLEQGANVTLPVSSAPREDPSGFEETSRIVEAIEAAQRQRARVAPSLSFEAWMSGHRDEPSPTWLAALRARDARYRDASEVPFTAVELGAVLDDPAADPRDRLAAAVALVARGAVENERVLSASRATAILPLLEGLRAALAGDDAGLERSRVALGAAATEDELAERSAPASRRARR